jgi:hypothetical protein
MLASLEVAFLLRVKQVPGEGETPPTLTLGLPDAFLGVDSDEDDDEAVADTGVTGFDPFAVSFGTPADMDGGLRFGFASRELDLTAATEEAIFGKLRNAPWSIALDLGSALAADDLEDAIVSVKWSLASLATGE